MSVADVGLEGVVALVAGDIRYQLFYGRPDDVVVGWTLLVRPEVHGRWSIRVPLHLGVGAGGQDARAAATRALAEQGVAVAGWDWGDQIDPPVFRARLADAANPTTTSPTTAPTGLAAFRTRGDALRGH